jgi:hypothetical protein
MGMQTVNKEQIIDMLNNLPPEGLLEVQQFLSYMEFKHHSQVGQPAVALGGLLDGYRFSEEEIAQARREMWARFDNRR